MGRDFEQYIQELNQIGGISFHCDVMDGIWCERKAMSMDQYIHLMKTAKHPVDVHLMINRPDLRKVNTYISVAAGPPRSLSIHAEIFTARTIVNLLRAIKTAKAQAGIVIDLPTDIATIDKKILNTADVITIMSVKAGKSGQTFNDAAIQKIKYIRENYPNKCLVVDGGVDQSIAQTLKNLGVSTAVMGSAVYNIEDRKGLIACLGRDG